MATVAYLAERSRKIGLSMARALVKGDEAAATKWALQQANVSTTLAVTLTPELAEEDDGLPVYDHVLTYDEEHEILLIAADEVLKALGRPYGHEGAERGALPLSKHIELAEALNLPLHLAEFKSLIVEGALQ